jgi:hypothetical protein
VSVKWFEVSRAVAWIVGPGLAEAADGTIHATAAPSRTAIPA